jgi:hypothetical protein
MPEIRGYNVDVDVDVDIDVDDFLEACSSNEINEVIDWLIDCEYIKQNQVIENGKMSLGDIEYTKIISKLTDPMVRFRLSEEEIIAIQQISDRL